MVCCAVQRRSEGPGKDQIMEAVYFTIVAVALYFLSDRLLRLVEGWLGRELEHRTLVFFGILLTLALASFALIRRLFG